MLLVDLGSRWALWPLTQPGAQDSGRSRQELTKLILWAGGILERKHEPPEARYLFLHLPPHSSDWEGSWICPNEKWGCTLGLGYGRLHSPWHKLKRVVSAQKYAGNLECFTETIGGWFCNSACLGVRKNMSVKIDMYKRAKIYHVLTHVRFSLQCLIYRSHPPNERGFTWSATFYRWEKWGSGFRWLAQGHTANKCKSKPLKPEVSLYNTPAFSPIFYWLPGLAGTYVCLYMHTSDTHDMMCIFGFVFLRRTAYLPKIAIVRDDTCWETKEKLQMPHFI